MSHFDHHLPFFLFAAFACSALFSISCTNSSDMPKIKTEALRVEYQNSPKAIDELYPRFSWRCENTAQELCQVAYHIRVVDTSTGEFVWDSGWRESEESIQIPYTGLPFKPFTKYQWFVSQRIRSSNGIYDTEPATAFFETGFLNTPWRADWIGTTPHSENLLPVPVFRKEYTVPSEFKLKSATLYITALGTFDGKINGKDFARESMRHADAISVSEGMNLFMPGWTQYDYRTQYMAFDVTDLICKDSPVNDITVRLSDGWYSGRITRLWSDHNKPTIGTQPVFKAEIHLVDDFGKKLIVSTDKTWQWQESDLKMSDIYDGETIDARTPPLMAGSEISSAYWENASEVVVFDKKNVDIVWMSGAPVRSLKKEYLSPISVKRRADGEIIVDFGENITGQEEVKLTDLGIKSGDKITIRHAEMLEADGSLYTANLRTAKSTTTYIASDDPDQVIRPIHSFYGFRYIGIRGISKDIPASQIFACPVHSDLHETGSFQCGNLLVNRLFKAILRGQLGNFLDVPTDCPQRDERLGWTADTQVFANAASYNLDCSTFYTKWIIDLNLARGKKGAYPSFAPDHYHGAETSKFFGYATGWSDAGIIVPWILYQKYGDRRILELYFDNMTRWLDFQIENSKGTFIIKNAIYADWLNLDAKLSEEFVSTAYLAGMLRLTAKIARIIGREKDAVTRDRLCQSVVEAFQKKFFTQSGELKEKTQTAALFVLNFHLAPDENVRRKTLDFLIHDIVDARQLHLSTGFLGTPILLHVLADNGQTELAFSLLQQTSYPSWLYPITQGATTMWERWNSWTEEKGFGDVGMNSFNHYAYGAVADWLYEYVAGIRPGHGEENVSPWKKFILAPSFHEKLKNANASFESMYGVIQSEWKMNENGNEVNWMFSIPANTSAKILIPSGWCLSSLCKIHDDAYCTVDLKKQESVLLSGHYSCSLRKESTQR